MMPLDCSKWKQQTYPVGFFSGTRNPILHILQLTYAYSTSEMAHAHGLDLNSFLS
jgi:hypothetical protein